MNSGELYKKALELRQCARSWVPEVKLLGNVSAKEIDLIICDYIKLRLGAGICGKNQNNDGE